MFTNTIDSRYNLTNCLSIATLGWFCFSFASSPHSSGVGPVALWELGPCWYVLLMLPCALACPISQLTRCIGLLGLRPPHPDNAKELVGNVLALMF